MKLKLECLPCIFRQTLEASRMVTEDGLLIKEIIDEYARIVPELGLDDIAPVIVSKIQHIIKRKAGTDDPYYQIKETNINNALDMYPEVKKIVEGYKDPLLGALIMAATGNSIDAALTLEVDIDDIVKRAVEDGFAYSNYDLFLEKIKEGGKVLIVADNAGEAVFDKLLIEELNKYGAEVTYAVREVPVLNDVTIKEARRIGLDRISKLISSGCDTPGCVLERANKEFLEIFNRADIVISKGQGNLEGLSEAERPIFFLLKAKCDTVADMLGVNAGNLVFKLI